MHPRAPVSTLSALAHYRGGGDQVGGGTEVTVGAKRGGVMPLMAVVRAYSCAHVTTGSVLAHHTSSVKIYPTEGNQGKYAPIPLAN